MIRFIPIADPPRGRVVWVTLAALAFALVVAGLIFLLAGTNPFEAYAAMLQGTVSDWSGWAEVLRRGTPLLLIGIGLTLAFRARFFNIGAEGQLLPGAVAAGGVALFTPLPPLLMLPAMFVAGRWAEACGR